MAKAIANENVKEISTLIINEFWIDNPYGEGSKLRKLQNKCQNAFFLRINKPNTKVSLEVAVAYYSNLKTAILNELSLKMDKAKTTEGLTKEYFEKELEKGNVDMVIIKLCVKLEAILKCDFHYTGDFSEMLQKYCSTFETYDDESNFYDPTTPRLLNILRQQRNGIVHSEVYEKKLTTDELNYCINHICKLG